MDNNIDSITLSVQALKRMPYYLQFLTNLQQQGVEYVSSTVVAENFNLGEVQVRKDLSAVSFKKGRPKSGFCVEDLIINIEKLLGYNDLKKAIIVGVGSIGKALIAYKGFNTYGLDISAGFDTNPDVVGKEIDGKKVLPMSELNAYCKANSVKICVIAVPAKFAQEVCDQVIESGVLAILNFAPIRLCTPKDIIVQNENVAVSLAVLSTHLDEKLLKQK